MEAGAWLLMLQLALLTSGLPAASCVGSWESSAPGALGAPGPWPGPSNPSTVSHSCSQGQKGQEPQGDSRRLDETRGGTLRNLQECPRKFHTPPSYVYKKNHWAIDSLYYCLLRRAIEQMRVSHHTQKNAKKIIRVSAKGAAPFSRFGTYFLANLLFIFLLF